MIVVLITLDDKSFNSEGNLTEIQYIYMHSYLLSCGFVSAFVLVIRGVDKGDRQIISHMAGKGEEGGKKPMHMNKQ